MLRTTAKRAAVCFTFLPSDFKALLNAQIVLVKNATDGSFNQWPVQSTGRRIWQRSGSRIKERAAALVTLWLPTLARESVAWMRAPSQPLMRLPLLRSQTPAAPRRTVGFFGFGGSTSCLIERITKPTSDRSILLGPTLSAVDFHRLSVPRWECSDVAHNCSE
jgi:hypothetical protein